MANGSASTMKERIILWFVIVVIVAVLATILNWPNWIVNRIIGNWVPSIFIGIITSGIAGTLIENLSGNTLKNIAWNIHLGPIKFSLTLFFIVTVLLKLIIF